MRRVFYDLLVHLLRVSWVPHASVRVGLGRIIVVTLLLYLVRVETHELGVSVVGASGPLACLNLLTPSLDLLATTLRWSDLLILEQHVICISGSLFRHKSPVCELLAVPLILTSACQ